MTTIPYQPKAIKPAVAGGLTFEDVQTRIDKLRMAESDPRTCVYDPSLSRTDVPIPPYHELPLPRGVDTVASFDLNILATSQDLIDLQHRANAYADARKRRSSWRELTLRHAVQDAGEALIGIPRDLFGMSRPLTLSELLTKNDRLRGLGVILVTLSLAFALISLA